MWLDWEIFRVPGNLIPKSTNAVRGVLLILLLSLDWLSLSFSLSLFENSFRKKWKSAGQDNKLWGTCSQTLWTHSHLNMQFAKESACG